MKKIILITLLLILVFFIFIFRDILFNKENNETDHYKIGFVINELGDRGFADSQAEGVKIASEKFGIPSETYITNSFDQIKNGMVKAIKEGSNIIICGNGVFGQEAILTLSEIYSQCYFICIDHEMPKYPKNVASITFKQNEGAFLAGILAAKMTKAKKVGFIGGVNIPVINDFYIGYENGVHYVSENIKLYEYYINPDYNDKEDNPFNSKEGGETLADKMYSEGVDIIFAAAGGSNLGIFSSARKNDQYAIGVDTDQDYIVIGHILTSMIKHVDTGIVYIIERIIEKRFENKNYRLGLKENGVDLSPMLYTKVRIGEENINYLETIKLRIITGLLIVPSAF